MVGPALKKYAKSHGLAVNGGFAYGALYGYRIALDDGQNIKRLFLVSRFTDDERKAAFEALLGSGDVVTHFRIQAREYRDNQLILVFTDKAGTMTLIGEFLDWLLPQLPQYGAAADVCTHCGGMTAGSGTWVVIDGLPYYMHESCLNSKTQIIRSNEETVRENLTGSYLTGFIGALLGGLLGSLIWAGVMYVGFIAGIVGFLIGFFANKGYALFKGKEGKGKLAILIVVILLCVIIGTLLGEYVSCLKEIPGLPFKTFVSLIKEYSEVRAAVLKDFLLGLLFAALSVIGLLARTKRETSGANIKVLK